MLDEAMGERWRSGGASLVGLHVGEESKLGWFLAFC